MERKASEIKWKNTGGGKFRMRNGKIIPPGGVFFAASVDIPKAFRDTIKPMEPEPELTVTPIKVTYSIERKGSWYHVMDNNGKQVNEKGLKKEAAEAMLNALEG
jgi:hypothetical protein